MYSLFEPGLFSLARLALPVQPDLGLVSCNALLLLKLFQVAQPVRNFFVFRI